MHARPWFVLTAICTLLCTSGCGSARWGSRHSRLRGPSACVEPSCDDPTCEICSPLPPLYDGMARNHRLNRRATRGHGRGHGYRGHGGYGGDCGCTCGQCGGEWFDGEIIDGEIIGGDFGGCSSCCSDGMMMDGGMGMSGGCSTCGQTVMHDSSMMPGQTFESHGEQQPTIAHPQRSSVPNGGPAAPYSPSTSVPAGDLAPAPAPADPMSKPMPMGESTSMRTPNYGAALFGTAQAEPMQYVPAPTSQPIIQEQAVPMQEIIQQPSAPPAPPLASPAAHAQPLLMSPPSIPSFPAPPSGAPQPSDFYTPKNGPSQPSLTQPNPIQLQSASIPAAPPAKKAFRPFSDSAKPRKPATDAQGQPLAQMPPQPLPLAQPQGQPQWEGTLQMQPIEQPTQTASAGWLPTLPSSK